MIIYKNIIWFLLFITLTSCNIFTYTPRTKRQVQREKPSVVLLQRMVEFREEFNSWPFSMEEFISKGQKYKDAIAGFPYRQTKFDVLDNNTMIFIFFDHKEDAYNYKQTGLTDLNSYHGQVRFYKEKDKFIWKLKMR
jgi:hypothetical protein